VDEMPDYKWLIENEERSMGIHGCHSSSLFYRA
jgi:hypothetical protein